MLPREQGFENRRGNRCVHLSVIGSADHAQMNAPIAPTVFKALSYRCKGPMSRDKASRGLAQKERI
jgi:hypothetical protein